MGGNDDLFKKVENDVRILRETFETGKTLSVSWRRKQLLDLKKLVSDGQDQLCEALTRDLHKSNIEGFLTEVQYRLWKQEMMVTLERLMCEQ